MITNNVDARIRGIANSGGLPIGLITHERKTGIKPFAYAVEVEMGSQKCEGYGEGDTSDDAYVAAVREATKKYKPAPLFRAETTPPQEVTLRRRVVIPHASATRVDDITDEVLETA